MPKYAFPKVRGSDFHRLSVWTEVHSKIDSSRGANRKLAENLQNNFTTLYSVFAISSYWVTPFEAQVKILRFQETSSYSGIGAIRNDS